jgi:chaperone required for assembly of F1-ATPase
MSETNGKGPRIDPGEAARRSQRTPLPQRFYKVAGTECTPEGFALVLDGRPARTPARHPLRLPTEAMAEAVAAEWAEQGVEIDPATMPLTRLANSAIDGVTSRRVEVIADMAAFAASDLVCYRADGPAALVARQAAAWDPVLAWAHERLGVDLRVATGVMPVAQPADTVARVAQALEPRSDFELAALHVMTTLMGSVVLALAHGEGRLSLEAVWAAAHVDEDWQISQWGEDAEAATRRTRRFAEMVSASRLLDLLRA